MGSSFSRHQRDSGEDKVSQPPEKSKSESSKTDVLQNQFNASPEKPKTSDKPKRLEEQKTSDKPNRMSDARRREILRDVQEMQAQLRRNKATIERSNGNRES